MTRARSCALSALREGLERGVYLLTNLLTYLLACSPTCLLTYLLALRAGLERCVVGRREGQREK